MGFTKEALERLINILVGIATVFLGLRFILKLFGANPNADFVSWIYSMTLPLLEPFRGAFPSPTVEEGFIFEFSTLFAIIIYLLIGWLIVELVYFIGNIVENKKLRKE